ncbi:hypothetical protein HBN54_003525 [Hymenobacter sp. 1B]|uniref:Uncharacterized protein n=1 Tax=Hymenobacter artigasi TaxID=2719616 RepID=A0ABX1HKW9_9BACT|nr:hypothetical protein [Hymenobacter artigasi]
MRQETRASNSGAGTGFPEPTIGVASSESRPGGGRYFGYYRLDKGE